VREHSRYYLAALTVVKGMPGCTVGGGVPSNDRPLIMPALRASLATSIEHVLAPVAPEVCHPKLWWLARFAHGTEAKVSSQSLAISESARTKVAIHHTFLLSVHVPELPNLPGCGSE